MPLISPVTGLWTDRSIVLSSGASARIKNQLVPLPTNSNDTMILVALPERQVGIAVRKVLSWARPLLTPCLQLSAQQLSTVAGYPAGEKLSVQSWKGFSVLCNQDIQSLQQQCFLIQLCWATKCDGRNYAGLGASRWQLPRDVSWSGYQNFHFTSHDFWDCHHPHTMVFFVQHFLKIMYFVFLS